MRSINFIARDEYSWQVAPRPFPIKQALPDYMRKEPPYIISEENPDGTRLIVDNLISNASFKKCTPMLDSLITGYAIPLWSDVQIRYKNNEPYITWRVKHPVFELHGYNTRNITPPTGYNSQVFKYLNRWIPRTPKGYSILVTQPFGYRDTPIHAVSAIVDSDKPTIEILPPVWIKENFEGVVEKGTPIVQLIPFKRDDWKSRFSFLKDGEYEKFEDSTFGSTLINHYIKNIWSKKKFQ